MKKAVWSAAIALLLAGLLLFAGCGGSGDNVSENASSNSASTEASSAAEGVPIYPGATEVDMSDMSEMMRGPGPGGPDSQGNPPNGSTPNSTENGTDAGDQDSSATMPPPQAGQMTPPAGTESGSAPSGMREMPVAYRTTDSVDKVVAWYREQLSGKTDFKEQEMPTRGESDQTGENGAAFSFKSGDTMKMVMIRKDTTNQNGGTLIMISNAPEGMPSAPQTNQE